MSADGPGRSPLGDGAAQEAPTAPHATPRARDSKRTGPERFWWRGERLGFLVALGLSLLLHAGAFPFEWPAGMEVKDVEGVAAIAVDLLESSEPEPAPPAPPSVEAPTPEAPATDSSGGKSHDSAPAASSTPGLDDAGARHPQDAGDASPDARPDGSEDGGSRALTDAEADTGADAGPDLGSRDTESIAGAAASIHGDVVLVAVLVNAELIRKNPVGASLGLLLRGIPQWEDFMSGTDIDPVRDTDWLMISGPSLVNTARDVILIRYGAADAVVDHAISRVSRKYAGGGPFDAGVPGMKATLAHADRAERVLLRPRPHVLALVSPADANRLARQLAVSGLPAHVLPEHRAEAVYFRFESPHRAVPEIPESISELRLRVVPRSETDNGAGVLVEGDTKDATKESAALAAAAVEDIIRRRNTGLVAIMTRRMFDRVEVRAEGTKVLAHLSVTLEDLETLESLAAWLLHVDLPEAPAAGAASASKGVAPPR